MIRYTARVVIANAIRAALESSDIGVDGTDRSEAVVTLEVSRDDLTELGEKGAIKEQIEDCADIRVVSVQVLHARCEECYSCAPHRCECVLAEGWTDDQELEVA